MELDASCLRWAKVENLERLARAVKVALPIHKRHNRDVYHRTLVRLIARALEDQSRDRGFMQPTAFS